MSPRQRRNETPEPSPDEGGKERGSPEADVGHLDIREILFGDFPQVTHLNSGFVPGIKRLKVTLTVSGPLSSGSTAGLVEALTGFLPSLSFHRCCGDNSVKETFFERGERRHCAMQETDAGVDLAHLLEHVLIDVQHYIARMKICSGVTCAWIDPGDRYDIFVECVEEAVGRLSMGIAVDILEDLLAGKRPDPRYLCLIQVARVAHDHPGLPVEPRLFPLTTTWGRRLVNDAVTALHGRGYLRETPVSFNFSGRPLLCFLKENVNDSLAS